MQVGWPKAKELLFTGKTLEPTEALEIGLLNHLVEPDEVLPKAIEIAKQIAANNDRMVQGVKELMMNDIGAEWRAMYDNEHIATETNLAPTPIDEGFKDFLDRKGRR